MWFPLPPAHSKPVEMIKKSPISSKPKLGSSAELIISFMPFHQALIGWLQDCSPVFYWLLILPFSFWFSEWVIWKLLWFSSYAVLRNRHTSAWLFTSWLGHGENITLLLNSILLTIVGYSQFIHVEKSLLKKSFIEVGHLPLNYLVTSTQDS